MPVPRNPYIAGKALSSGRSFAGREDVFQLVQTVLGQSDTNAIVLFGQRRIGKTSILLNLQQRLPSPPFVTVFFDLQDRARKPLGDVLFELAQTIAQELGMPGPDRTRFDDAGAGFREVFLPAAYQTLGDERRLVLLFDEFDVLDAHQEEQLPPTSAARAFIPAMRRLINEEPRVGFVFVVGRKADELSIEFMSAFKAARFYRISVLDPDAARELVLTAQRAGALQFAEGVPERIFALTAGHPYLTQLLCQLLFEQAYAPAAAGTASAPPLVTLADVEAIVPKALEAGEHIFEWIWDGLPPAERVIFSAVAAGTDERCVITEERLLEILQAQGIRILIRELELAPKTLVDWQMLRATDGGYQFYVELMRRWVASRKPLQRVRDELDRINPLADLLYQTAAGFYRNAPMDSSALDRAADQLRTALNVNPQHVKARLLLADIFKMRGDHEAAVRELADAYRIDQDGVRLPYEAALLQQAEALEKAGRLEDAIAVYVRVIEVSPNNRSAQERKVQAEQTIARRIIEADSTRAAEYEQAERWQDAADSYRRLASVSDDPRWAEALARVERTIARRAIEADSTWAAGREAGGFWEDAADSYRRLASLDDDPRWAEALARVERERDLAQRYAVGLTAASEHRWAEAQQAFGEVVSLRPTYADAAERLGQAAQRHRVQQTRAERDARYALDSPQGRLTFWLAWVSAGTAGWLVMVALAALGLLIFPRAPVEAPIAVGLLAAAAAFISVPILQNLALARFRQRWDLARRPGLAAFASFPAAASFLGIIASVLVALAVVFAVVGVVFGTLSDLLIGAIVVSVEALVLGIPASLIQWQPLRGFEGAQRWLWASVAGRAVGLGAGSAVALAIWQRFGAALRSFDRAWLPVLALACGAVLWGLISSGIVGAALTSLLAREQAGQSGGEPDARRAAGNDVVQTLLPAVTGLIAIIALAVGLGWLSRAPAGVVFEMTGEPGAFGVDRAAFAPASDRFVTISDSTGIVPVWDVATGKHLLQISGHTAGVNAAEFSPDGYAIVTASLDGTARVWDAATGRELRRLEGHAGGVNTAGFSPDGKSILTAGNDGAACVWDAATGEERYWLSCDPEERSQPSSDPGSCYAGFSPDGKWIITLLGWADTIRVWDAASGGVHCELSGHTDDVEYAAFSTDGRSIVTASRDTTARVWDTATCQELHQLSGHSDGLYSAEFSPDGRQIVTAADEDTARVWDATTGEELLQLAHDYYQVEIATFSPDGKYIVTATFDEGARVWDAATGRELRRLRGHAYMPDTASVISVQVSPDSRWIVTTALDGTARLYPLPGRR